MYGPEGRKKGLKFSWEGKNLGNQNINQREKSFVSHFFD